MKPSFALGGICAVALSASPAFADETVPTIVYTEPAPQTPPAVAATPSQPPAALPQPAPAEAPPPQVVVEAQQPVASAGEWVYTAQSGYIWVPTGTTTQVIEGVPSAYFYTPAYGWTWYASPWGMGPFAYGAWVARPWPYGIRAWGPGGWRAGGVGFRGVGGTYGGAGHYYGAGGVRYAHTAGGHFGRGFGHFGGHR